MNSNIKNVAIIMDGNGRWAKKRHHPRFHGHIRGASIVSSLVEAASDARLASLTLYAFSTENFQRPLEEKSVLFKLLRKFLVKEFARILKNNIRFKVIGSIDTLNSETQRIIKDLESESSTNTGLKLNFAFAYGGRDEIVQGINKIIDLKLTDKITEVEFSQYLYDRDVCDIDLLIRTGGDMRISNFLLWQMAYAELFFTKTLWPDFTVAEFLEILHTVENRQRRFGNIDSVQITLDKSINENANY